MFSALAQSLAYSIAAQTIGLAHTTLMQIAAVGSLVELLGNGEHSLNSPFA